VGLRLSRSSVVSHGQDAVKCSGPLSSQPDRLFQIANLPAQFVDAFGGLAITARHGPAIRLIQRQAIEAVVESRPDYLRRSRYGFDVAECPTDRLIAPGQVYVREAPGSLTVPYPPHVILRARQARKNPRRSGGGFRR
jgi:hypothetical protein